MTTLRSAAGPGAALAGTVVGIVVGERAGPAPATGALVAGFVALAACVVVRRPPVTLAVAVVACALLASASTCRALDGLVHSPITRLVDDRATAVVHGTLAEDPVPNRFGASVLVRLRDVDDGVSARRAGGRIVLARASRDVGARMSILEAGDRVVVRGRLVPLTGYDARFTWRHAVARLTVTDVLDARRPTSPLARLANTARHAVLGGTRFLPLTQRGLVAGFLLGDTRNVPATVVDEFRASGLSHLVAVSGENVAFVLALAGPLLRRVGRWPRLVVALAVVVTFGAMTRWEPSVLRAIAMTAVSMLAVHLGRPIATLRVLAIAATVLLLADPFLLHSVGFALSCGACCGIALLATALARRLPGPSVVCEPFAVTAAAQLGVLPIELGVFGSMPLVALPANVAAAVAVGPLTTFGLAGGVLGGLAARHAPAFAWLAQQPARLLSGYVALVAHVGARVPVALDPRGAALLAAVAFVLTAVVVAMRRPGSVRPDARVPSRRAHPRPDDSHARDGHPQPDAGLVLRPR
ncbi:MAG TPA: ComEC/Rec2 family competence protein [Acidimicrobiia bacterium]|nr:ComEC/Rec2 family competence protein [Acidimicrobiia bacterium]